MQPPIQAIENYLKGMASDEEIQLVNEWYNSFNDEVVTISSDNRRLRELINRRIYKRLDQSIGNKPYFVKRSTARVQWAAAVFIPLLLLAGVFVFMARSKRDPGTTIPSKSAASVIVPGGNRATLTLANGNQIVLDSMGDGAIGSQGNVQIIKIANGQIRYAINGKNNDASEIPYNTITTPRGGQYQVQLPDGTLVWLNAASSLRFPTVFNNNVREVYLTGEGYFEVAHASALDGHIRRPFVVSVIGSNGTKGMKITVLGTKFNIMSYADEDAIKTTLVEGSVEASNSIDKVKITPGKQAVLPTDKDHFRIAEANLQEVLAWKNGEFWFDKMNIKGIMRQLARWYNIKVAYRGNMDDIALSGVIPKKQNVRELLDIFETTGSVRFQIEGDVIFAMSK